MLFCTPNMFQLHFYFPRSNSWVVCDPLENCFMESQNDVALFCECFFQSFAHSGKLNRHIRSAELVCHQQVRQKQDKSGGKAFLFVSFNYIDVHVFQIYWRVLTEASFICQGQANKGWIKHWSVCCLWC